MTAKKQWKSPHLNVESQFNVFLEISTIFPSTSPGQLILNATQEKKTIRNYPLESKSFSTNLLSCHQFGKFGSTNVTSHIFSDHIFITQWNDVRIMPCVVSFCSGNNYLPFICVHVEWGEIKNGETLNKSMRVNVNVLL